ncbi:MAG TPA: hypothetical protein VKD19_02180 [Pseudolabrys sp.]|nr:hypothetical protein [Pseudolabrys sp.]
MLRKAFQSSKGLRFVGRAAELSQGFCSRIQDGLMQPPTYSSAKKCGAQPPSWWHGSWFGNWYETNSNHHG